MSVLLRDRLYGDTGLPVQGATVQAYLITGGGTDAGTGSVLTASTTTDVNGVWKFSGTTLADPGAGNWYDVKIINGQQVRWRYGNIEAVIASLQLQGTVWASPHFTTPVVDSGGLTITAGGLTVPAGTVNLTGASVIANLPNTHAACSGGVPLSVSGTWFAVTGCTMNLAAGTYLVTAHAEFSSSGTGANLVEARIWDGTSYWGQAGASLCTTSGINWTSVTVSNIFTTASLLTLTLQAAFNGAGTQAISVNQTSPVSGATATFLNAVRLA